MTSGVLEVKERAGTWAPCSLWPRGITLSASGDLVQDDQENSCYSTALQAWGNEF